MNNNVASKMVRNSTRLFLAYHLAGLATIITAPTALAYDVTGVTLVPNPQNDAPATTIQKVPKRSEEGDELLEVEEKVFMPRNDKLQRFDFQATGRFTRRDFDNRDATTQTMPIQANFVDVQTDGASIALTVLFGTPGRTRRAVTMASFQGEVPMTFETKEGDTWTLSGSFQVGCTTDGKVFGSAGRRINRFSGAIEFPGDRTFKLYRIECEPLPEKPPQP